MSTIAQYQDELSKSQDERTKVADQKKNREELNRHYVRDIEFGIRGYRQLTDGPARYSQREPAAIQRDISDQTVAATQLKTIVDSLPR